MGLICGAAFAVWAPHEIDRQEGGSGTATDITSAPAEYRTSEPDFALVEPFVLRSLAVWPRSSCRQFPGNLPPRS